MSPVTLAHLGYAVADMDSAVRRWEESGGVVVIPPTLDPIQKVICCLLEVDGVLPVELVAPAATGDSPIDARLKRGGGLDHVCYHVDDLEVALDRERSRGSVVVCEPVYAVTFDRDIAFVQRRTGMVVEFMTREPAAKPGTR